MMWVVAWVQVPCGSFPNDETVIRAKCRLSPEMWASCRDVLMRGWWEASDGRLYHDTLTKRVMEMMGRRRSDSDRQASKRARQATEFIVTSPVVTRDTAVTLTEVTRESSTDNRLPNTKEEIQKRAPRKRVATSASPSCPEDVTEQVWSDWVALRKLKRASVSVTAVAEARREAAKADVTFDRFLTIWCARGSQGLEASWIKPHERTGAAVIPINRQEAIEQRNREVGDRWLAEQEALDASR